MKYVFAGLMALAAGPVQAHPGHLAEVAGHGHWLGAAAIGAAIAIGLWAAVKGRRDAQAAQDETLEDDAADDAVQEA